ncbi:hypothetical protein YC2023_086230 [Brassica napus]
MECITLYEKKLNSLNRRLGVRHSTFESLRLGRSCHSIASGFLQFWDSLNFKKDRDFVGITVLFLDENVLSMYKITDHPFLIGFISLTIIDEVIMGAPEINLLSRLDYVVGQIRSVQGSALTKEITRVVICLLIDTLKETTITQTIKTPKTRIPKKDRIINDQLSFCLILQINFKTNITNQSTQLKLNDTYIEPAKQIQTTRPAI